MMLSPSTATVPQMMLSPSSARAEPHDDAGAQAFAFGLMYAAA